MIANLKIFYTYFTNYGNWTWSTQGYKFFQNASGGETILKFPSCYLCSSYITLIISLYNFIIILHTLPGNIYLCKFNNTNARKRCEIFKFVKFIIKTPERRHWRCSGFFCFWKLWTYFTSFSSASFANFEQANVSWAANLLCNLKAKFLRNHFYFINTNNFFLLNHTKLVTILHDMDLNFEYTIDKEEKQCINKNTYY